jgi:hypothetical protein
MKGAFRALPRGLIFPNLPVAALIEIPVCFLKTGLLIFTEVE